VPESGRAESSFSGSSMMGLPASAEPVYTSARPFGVMVTALLIA
jgi:hypothetical protein